MDGDRRRSTAGGRGRTESSGRWESSRAVSPSARSVPTRASAAATGWIRCGRRASSGMVKKLPYSQMTGAGEAAGGAAAMAAVRCRTLSTRSRRAGSTAMAARSWQHAPHHVLAQDQAFFRHLSRDCLTHGLPGQVGRRHDTAVVVQFCVDLPAAAQGERAQHPTAQPGARIARDVLQARRGGRRSGPERARSPGSGRAAWRKSHGARWTSLIRRSWAGSSSSSVVSRSSRSPASASACRIRPRTGGMRPPLDGRPPAHGLRSGRAVCTRSGPTSVCSPAAGRRAR